MSQEHARQAAEASAEAGPVAVTPQQQVVPDMPRFVSHR
jgi:hypothetical protein